MAAKEGGATNLVTYEEFEPFGKWQRAEDRDTLTLDLPEFKKEELRVHINNRGILKISGERPVDASKKCKFYKEVAVPKNCDSARIAAKFAHNKLQIILPKRAANEAAVPEQNKPPQEAKSSKIVAFPSGKKLTKMASNAGMVLILLAAIIAFVVYMYKSTLIED